MPILSLLSIELALKMMKMLLTLDGQMYKEKARKTLLRITSLRAYKSKLIKKIKKLEDCLMITDSNIKKN